MRNQWSDASYGVREKVLLTGNFQSYLLPGNRALYNRVELLGETISVDTISS